MTGLLQAAADLQAFCESKHWRYCFIGGLAVLRWGEPRQTVDVDLTLVTGFTHESQYVSELLGRFEGRRADAADFARSHRVLLLRSSSGVGLDVALGGMPFEESAVARSTMYRFPPDVPLRTCSAEDLLVFKAFAGRPKDWMDVEGVVTRQAATLDWDYVFANLAPLAELKEAPELLDQLAEVRARLGA